MLGAFLPVWIGRDLGLIAIVNAENDLRSGIWLKRKSINVQLIQRRAVTVQNGSFVVFGGTDEIQALLIQLPMINVSKLTILDTMV